MIIATPRTGRPRRPVRRPAEVNAGRTNDHRCTTHRARSLQPRRSMTRTPDLRAGARRFMRGRRADAKQAARLTRKSPHTPRRCRARGLHGIAVAAADKRELRTLHRGAQRSRVLLNMSFQTRRHSRRPRRRHRAAPPLALGARSAQTGVGAQLRAARKRDTTRERCCAAVSGSCRPRWRAALRQGSTTSALPATSRPRARRPRAPPARPPWRTCRATAAC